MATKLFDIGWKREIVAIARVEYIAILYFGFIHASNCGLTFFIRAPARFVPQPPTRMQSTSPCWYSLVTTFTVLASCGLAGGVIHCSTSTRSSCWMHNIWCLFAVLLSIVEITFTTVR